MSVYSYAETLESYIIAEEGISSYFKNRKNKKEKVAQKKKELLETDPFDVAKMVFNKIKSKVKLDNSEDAKNEIIVTYKNYVNNPGKVNPTKSSLITINGIPCIVTTKKDKFQKDVFALLTYPVINDKTNKTVLDICSLNSAATFLSE